MAGINIPISLSDGMTSPLESITNDVNKAVRAFENLKGILSSDFSSGLDDVGKSTIENRNFQEEHNRSIREGANSADGLLGKIKGIAGAYLGFQGIKKMISLGDAMVSNQVAVGQINDGLQTNADLNREIFDLAQRTRTAYMDTSAVVGKLGLLAKDAFSSNAELLRFTELINKSFKISGAGAQEQKAAMYQLTQAMASGVLQGDEFRSIRENAPLLAQAIQKELDGIDMKKASAEGLITNDVIKRAMFSMADEIDSRFDKFPKTFSSLSTQMANNFLAGMSPVWGALSRLWNNKHVLSFVDSTLALFNLLGNGIAFVIDGINGAITFLGNNIDILGPIILGVVGAFALYNAALMVCAMWHGIVGVAEGIHTGVMIAWTIVTGQMTLAQWGFNSALLACPITWIILAIIALISILFVVIAVINRVTGAHISGIGVICGAFAFLGSLAINIFIGILNISMMVVQGVVNLFQLGINGIINHFLTLLRNVLTVARGITSCFDSVATNIANAMVDGINIAIRAVNWLIDALNMIPGVNLGKIGEMSHTTSITHTIDNRIASIDAQIAKNNSGLNLWKAPKLDYLDMGKAYQSGYDFGKGLGDKAKGLLDFGKSKNNKENYDPSQFIDGKSPLGGTGAGKALKDTAGNTKKIAENTENSKLDVKYLREMAERQAINRFTTAEININNNISNVREEDLDGFVDHLDNEILERLEYQSEGYYKA